MKRCTVLVFMVVFMFFSTIVFAQKPLAIRKHVSLEGRWIVYGDGLQGYVSLDKRGRVERGIFEVNRDMQGEIEITEGRLRCSRRRSKVIGMLYESSGTRIRTVGTILNGADAIEGIFTFMSGGTQVEFVMIKEASLRALLEGKWTVYADYIKGYMLVEDLGDVAGGMLTVTGPDAFGEIEIAEGSLQYYPVARKIAGSLYGSQGLVIEFEVSVLKSKDAAVGHLMIGAWGGEQRLLMLVKE